MGIKTKNMYFQTFGTLKHPNIFVSNANKIHIGNSKRTNPKYKQNNTKYTTHAVPIFVNEITVLTNWCNQKKPFGTKYKNRKLKMVLSIIIVCIACIFQQSGKVMHIHCLQKVFT